MDKDPEKRSRGAIVEKPVGLRIHPDYNNINSVSFFQIEIILLEHLKNNIIYNMSRTTI